ncbi:MAG TPA: WbuC family cupin fold metalloprotein [Blastocatellia bacterium]|nr:WbuC family cupin fold metalloprotein [Blastocatellia bacterium]
MSDRKIQIIDDRLLDELLIRAAQSARKRAILRLHEGDWEHCHRMLNALKVGTYIRPHRHVSEHNSEGFIVLRGTLALLIFDDDGGVIHAESRVLDAARGVFGMDVAPNIWHTLIALEDTVIYEVKGHPAGGYVEESAKNFSPWSPAEGSEEAGIYSRELERQARSLAGAR